MEVNASPQLDYQKLASHLAELLTRANVELAIARAERDTAIEAMQALEGTQMSTRATAVVHDATQVPGDD